MLHGPTVRDPGDSVVGAVYGVLTTYTQVGDDWKRVETIKTKVVE